MPAGMAQELARFVRLEIADGRAREKADTRQLFDRRWKLKLLREIAD
jgi:hypothetical protein